MAVLTTAVTTASGAADALNKAWKKVHGKTSQGFQFESEEYNALDEVTEEEMPYTLRQSTDGGEASFPVDLNEQGGIASIPEGGYEAKPSSVGLEEARWFVQHFIGRFNVALLAKYADKGMENQLERQLGLQAAKKVQGIAAHYSDYWHGSSTAILALTDTDIAASASQSIVLKSGYGNSAITSLPFIADKFKVGDRIAILNAGSFHCSGTITAVTKSTGTLAVTWDATPSALTTNGLQVVKSNSMEYGNVTGTDYNRGLVGWEDILTSSALHGLTHTNWSVAYSDTTAGRFTGLKLRRADNEIQNQGGGKGKCVIWSQGVERDVIALERAAVRFGDPFGIELDGSVKSKGRTFFSSRRCVPGRVIVYDPSAVRKKVLVGKPEDSVSFAQGKEYIDQNAMVFRVELVVGNVIKSRKNIAYFDSQTES